MAALFVLLKEPSTTPESLGAIHGQIHALSASLSSYNNILLPLLPAVAVADPLGENFPESPNRSPDGPPFLEWGNKRTPGVARFVAPITSSSLRCSPTESPMNASAHREIEWF